MVAIVIAKEALTKYMLLSSYQRRCHLLPCPLLLVLVMLDVLFFCFFVGVLVSPIAAAVSKDKVTSKRRGIGLVFVVSFATDRGEG